MPFADKNWELRPTGISKDEYPNTDSWTNARWAWEFLRRDKGFQKWCHKVQKTRPKNTKRQTKKKFGLLRFMPYWEEFSLPYKGGPVFSTRNFQIWPCVDNGNPAIAPRKKTVELVDGELLIRLARTKLPCFH